MAACSDEDYAHAKRVWEAFGCRTMADYMRVYLKSDVLLLADVFEHFRSTCIGSYDIDPAHLVSAPQFSWEAMLHMVNHPVDLISDPAMYRMIDSGIRGGISTITKRYARANNPYMGELYDPSQPKSYIMYWDVNNLYGAAMRMKLPEGEFKWLKRAEINAIDWFKISEDDNFGYIAEVDLIYPPELHDLHNDFPMAAERLGITVDMLSDGQIQIRRQYDMARANVSSKLAPNLLDKHNYVCAGLLLKFYMEHGLKLDKV